MRNQPSPIGSARHFLIRLSDGAARLILDPFHGGRTLDAVALRELMEALDWLGIESPEAM